jgi:hypothetical protein
LRVRVAGWRLSAALLVLAGCMNRAREERRIPLHADWPDGETAVYDVMRGDSLVGRSRQRIDQTVLNGAPVYDVVSVNMTTIADVAQLHDSFATQLRRSDLSPIQGFQVSSIAIRQDTVVSNYEPGRVRLGRSGGQRLVLKTPANSYDNSALLIVMRALEFRPGAKYALNSIAAFAGSVKPADVEFAAEETVETPAGEFLCNRVTLQIAGHTLQVWYEKAAPHRYVRFENPAAGSSAVLARYGVGQSEEAR